MATFPMARNDDDVDSTTQAINHMHDEDIGLFLRTFGKDKTP
jgi:phage terminase large subunit-like protein